MTHSTPGCSRCPVSRSAIREAATPESGLQKYAHFVTALGRLRLLSPVFLTTVLLPLLAWFSRERERLFLAGKRPALVLLSAFCSAPWADLWTAT